MCLLKYFWVSFWNIFMSIHRNISCVFFMICVQDKNIDTPVSPSSPESVGAGQVIVPGESGLVNGVALQSGALEVWSDHYFTDITTDNRSFQFHDLDQSERSMLMVFDQWECSPLLACELPVLTMLLKHNQQRTERERTGISRSHRLGSLNWDMNQPASLTTILYNKY